MPAELGSDASPLAAGDGLLDVLAGFVKELRTAGIPVSLTENLDAVEALRHVPLDDREAFKYSLAATMVKNNSTGKPSRPSSRSTSPSAAAATTSRRTPAPKKPTIWCRSCSVPVRPRAATRAKG